MIFLKCVIPTHINSQFLLQRERTGGAKNLFSKDSHVYCQYLICSAMHIAKKAAAPTMCIVY